MPRSPYHRGHVILRRGAGWTVPDYMPENAEPIGILQARRLIESMEADGAPALRPESVTWDTAISAPSKVNLAVYVTEALPPLGCGRGDPVRVTIRRLEPREGGEDDGDTHSDTRRLDRGNAGVRRDAGGGRLPHAGRDRRGPHTRYLRHHRRDAGFLVGGGPPILP